MSHRILTDKRGINQAYIKSVLEYHPETGVFIWKQRLNATKTFNTRFAGQEAKNVHATNDGNHYIRITLKKTNYHAHRLAWLYVHGYWPNQIDHINGDGLDNRIENLRDVNNQANGMNQKTNKNNKSGVMGVSWDKSRNKWQSKIKYNQKQIHLGRFSSFNEACQARYAAEIKYGFHPNHGKR